MSSEKKFLPKLYPGNNKIERTWYVEYTAKDGLRKKVYGQLNKLPTVELRLLEADKLINEIIAKDQLAPAKGLGNQLLADLQEVYELRKPGWAPKSNSAYQTHFYSFAKWYRANGCPAMDIRQASAFLNHLTASGVNNTTRNNYRHNLKSLFLSLNKYFKNRYTDNPFADTSKFPQNQRTKEWFRPQQVQQLKEVIAATDPYLWLSCRMMFHCFARPNELRQVRIADIIFDTKRLRIQSLVAKTTKVRYIPIPPHLLADLEQYKNLPGQHYLFGKFDCPGPYKYGRDYMSKRHKEILTGLKYHDGFTYYGWKNTGAVKMLCMDNKNMRYISKCMGHHSLDMTDKYFESLGVDEMGEVINFPLI